METKLEIDKLYSLSPMQSGMLFHYLLNEDSDSYKIQNIFWIKGNISKERLEKSFNKVIEKYDILRTAFVYDKLKAPKQIVFKRRPITVKYEDVSHLQKHIKEKYIKEFEETDRNRDFNLTKDCLMRISLLKSSQEDYLLIWTTHHIILDGWCLPIIYRDVMEFYYSLCCGKKIKLKEVIPYRTYIDWLNEQGGEEGIEYWKKYLSGYEERSTLPQTLTGSTEDVYDLKELFFDLDEVISEELNKIAVSNNVTINTFFQVMWGLLLHRYNNSCDSVFGAVVSGRSSEIEGIEDMIGLFINTIPVRIKAEKGDIFVDLLQRVQKESIESKHYEYLPLSEVQSVTELKSELIDHIMAFENYPISEELKRSEGQLDLGFVIERFESYERTNYGFYIEILPGRRIGFKFNYNGNGYTKQTIDKVAIHLKNIINNILGEPGQRLSRLEILSEDERHRLLFEFNATEVEYPKDKSIFHFIQKHSSCTPDRVSLVCNENTITYYELNKRTDFLSKVLKMKGIGKDKLVGILMERSPLMVECILAIWKSGGAYIPVDVFNPVSRIKEILNDSGSNLLLTESGSFLLLTEPTYVSTDLMKKYEGELLKIHKSFGECSAHIAEEEDYLGIEFDMKGLSYVIYTSGSTGKPKGAMVEHIGMMNHIHAKLNDLKIKDTSIIAQNASHTFDISVWQFFSALVCGGRTIIYPRESILDIEGLLGKVIRDQISILEVVPSYLSEILDILEKNPRPLGFLRNLVVTGETVKPGLVKRWFNIYPDIKMVNAYGPTEASDDITHYIMEEFPKTERIYIGKPLQNFNLYLVNESMQLCPVGVKGEICVSGIGVGRGYLNDDMKTHKVFLDDPFVKSRGRRLYKTGDLGCWLEDGNIDFFGRVDDQIKIRGFRIELREIESQLQKYEEIKDAVVILREELNGEKYLCAYVVSENGLNISGLREFLSTKLPDYMIPSYFVQMDKLPLTPNGKLDRKALPEPEIEVGDRYVPPRNDTERKLVKIWSEVLNIDKNIIGIDNNFFELGGHSLKATILISRIHREFNVRINLGEMFVNPTIEGLSNAIKEGIRDEYVKIEVSEKKEYYPLSPAQKRLYILQQMEIRNISYNIQEVMELREDVDLEKLEEVFMEIILRHESLRSSFDIVNNDPVQKINRDVDFKIESYHLDTDVSDIDNDNSFINRGVSSVMGRFVRPFDLSKAPLFRVGIINVDSSNPIVLFDLHHIITDGTSQVVLKREFYSLYSGAGGELPLLRLQYKDFAKWQNSKEQQELVKDQEKYWLKEFSDELPVLNLPTDFSRPLVQSFEGAAVSFLLNPEETEGIGAIARDNDVTLFMVMLSIFNIFLSKLSDSDQEDIIVGTPIAGRRHADVENIIGMFVNSLALRNSPRGDKSFKEFLDEVKRMTLEAHENQEYQFEDLVDRLFVKRDASRNPIFDVMLNVLNHDDYKGDISFEVESGYRHIDSQSKFDLSISVVDFGDNISSSFEYCTKLFNAGTIEKFISYFRRIISTILTKPEMKLSNIEIISGEEREQILYEFNAAEEDYPGDKTIHELFEEQVERTPDNTALMFDDSQLTYRSLNGRSNQLAVVLRENGVKPNSIVGIMVNRSLEMIIGIMGILKSGGAYLPIDSEYPEERISFMLNDSAVEIILTKKQLLSSKVRFKCKLIDLNEVNLYKRSRENLERMNISKDSLYILYTSGSTGRPKGVIVQHSSFVNRLYWLKKRYQLNKNDVILQKTPYTFDVSACEIFRWIIGGSKLLLYIDEKENDPGKIIEFIEKYKITTVDFVPSILNVFLDYFDSKILSKRLLSLRWIFVGVESVSKPLVKKFNEKFRENNGPKLINAYGPTEATVDVSYFDCTVDNVDSEYRVVPIGKPIQNTQIYIQENLNFQPIGVAGELRIGGNSTSRGYLNEPELTVEKFIQNPFKRRDRLFKTGDLGCWLPDGNIEFLGRIDDQIKIRGYRIELGEIESRLLRHDLIEDTVVLSIEDDRGDKYLCAYIVSKKAERQETLIDISELRKYLSTFLPEYMVPSYFVEMDSIPLTSNGKVDRRALPEPERVSGEEYVAPGNETEKKLTGIWSEVLDLERGVIGIESNFFELGGHSLKATILISKLHREFDTKVPLSEIFKNPTIRGISAYIMNSKKEIYESIEPIEKREYYVLSSAQKRMYFLQQFDLYSTSYNMPNVLEFKGKINRDKLYEIFRKLILRHESLRTSFEIIEGEPIQRIYKDVEFKMRSYKVKGENQGKIKKSVEEVIKRFIRPFDLKEAPLLRIGIIELENKEILMFDIHHIISDGISSQLLEEEFISLYEGNSLPDFRLQYKDYAVWQNSKGQRELIKEQEEYWVHQLSDELPVLNLPMDYPRPSIQSIEGSLIEFELDRLESEGIYKIVRNNNATLYMVLLSIFTILFSRLSGQEDIIIGSPIAARRHTDIKNIIGMFINTLAMRNHPNGKKKYNEFLQEVKLRTLESYENQEYQFEDLVDKLSISRDTSRHPIFDVMFVLQNIDLSEGEISDVNIRPYKFEKRVSEFDIGLSCFENKGRIYFSLEYSTTLFKKETIERYIKYFREIISSIAEDTDIRISDIEILTDHEKEQLLYEFNDTEANYPGDKTIHELFEEQVNRKPNNTALVYKDKQLTYSFLNERSNQLALILREKGIKSNHTVGIILDHSLEMIIGILGILKSGGAYLPIDPEFPEERIKYILDDSNVEIILTDKNRVNKILLGDLKESRKDKIVPYICKRREQIKDFDNMPIPDRSLVDNEKYNQYIGQVMAKHCITIQATRGCPYKCAYCHKIWPKSHVVRSAENIFSEVLVYYKMGFRRFAFIDDIFNLNRNNSKRFFELVIKNKLNIQMFFPNGMRGDILTKEYIDLMVKAGVVNIALALETASPRLQKLIEKNINLAKLKENVDYISEKYPHVITEFFTMHGFPTETKEEATMTLEFIKSIKWVHFPYIFLLNIYPNTDMEKLAVKSGISKKAILSSNKQAFHELPQTLPFEEKFTQEIQSDFLQNYFLKKERLLFVLPYQMKILSEDEIVQKYNSYLPVENRTFEDFLNFVNIQREELSTKSGIDETSFSVPEVNHKMEKFFGEKKIDNNSNALRILLFDLSQSFSEESHLLNYLIAPPLGLMYLLTYLQKQFGNKVYGKIAKPIIDFDNYKELKILLNEFKPDVIGIRTLTFYKDFFHKIVDIIRRFGFTGPIIGGGPYATSDYTSLLQDENVDAAVLGEGEITFAELIKEILNNNKKLPDDEILKGIHGISFIPDRNQMRSKFSKEIILLDEFQENFPVKYEKNLTHINRPGDLAYAIYTSGTVGRPKGTLITHSSLNNLCFWHNRAYKVTDSDNATKYAGFGFDASVWEIFPYIIKNAKIHIIDDEVKLDVYRLNEYFERHDITISYLPTQICQHFMSMSNRSLRILLTGGDKLSRFEKGNYQLVNNYGPTENAVVTTYFNVDYKWDNIPIGSPVDNVRLYILGQNNQLQVAGTPGELCIGGNSLSIGYLNCLEETSERFINNPYEPGEKIYCTGDLVRWLPDGNIEFLGRKDDQVKIRGFRIELGEIESQLLTHKWIENAVVLSREDDGGDKYLCAYIVIEEGQRQPVGKVESDKQSMSMSIDATEFRDYLSKRLPEYMVPSYFIQIDKVPLTANGKIDRKSLPDPKITFGNEYIAPRNEIEERLVVIWSEILGIEKQKIGINFNFFDLGGHSLKAVLLISKVQETLNVNIPISNIFKEPTIENLSILINFAKNREAPNIKKEDREKIVL